MASQTVEQRLEMFDMGKERGNDFLKATKGISDPYEFAKAMDMVNSMHQYHHSFAKDPAYRTGLQYGIRS